MLPTTVETTRVRTSLSKASSDMTSIFRPLRASTSLNPTVKLNDLIEARPKANHKKERFSGSVGLKVLKDFNQYLLMSTHVIIEVILAKSHRETVFSRSRDRFGKLDCD